MVGRRDPLRRDHRRGASDDPGEVDDPGGHHDPQHEEGHPDHLRGAPAEGQDLLRKDDQRQQQHPGQTHDPRGHQHRKQGPATAETVEPVDDAHLEGATVAFAPVLHYEPKRAAAVVEADALEGRQLVEPGQAQDGSERERRPGLAIRGAELPRRVAGDLDEQPGDAADDRPDQEVATDEDLGRDEGPADGLTPGSCGLKQQDHRRRGGEHHRRHHHGPGQDEGTQSGP